MKFTKSELEMIFQYAAADKAETLAGMKEIVAVIKDTLTRAIVENAIGKLQKIPEPECSRFIADTKAYFVEERDKSIRRQLAEAATQAATSTETMSDKIKRMLKNEIQQM